MIEGIPEYILRALLAGFGVAMAAGPLGALVVWQRMAYFGDALAHASLLGIALSLFFAVNVTFGVLAVALMVAILLGTLQAHSWFSNDTLLGILAHTGLALGLMSFSLLPGTRIDLMSYLYGDILAVTWLEVGVIYAGGLLVLGILSLMWSKVLRYVIHPDLAKVEGVNIRQVRWLFVILLAFVVAIGIKIVGVLLMTALLIIPAAAARVLARSPESLAVLASLLGILGVFLGMQISLHVDVPTGPAIVAVLALTFVGMLALKKNKAN